MALSGKADIDEALQKVGELLASENESYAIVVVGGAAMNLLGFVERVTTDVDILAFAHTTGGEPAELEEAPKPMPAPLVRAARTVARDLGLETDWLNTGPALQWQSGFPPGLAQRVRWRRYAALHVGLVDRRDLIFLKLYAAADAKGPESVHYQDLVALMPNPDDLQAAKDWVEAQDPSPGFQATLEKVVTHVATDLKFDGRNKPESAR
jgi:Nucleotidyltransferase of unknown function (DUF6036)